MLRATHANITCSIGISMISLYFPVFFIQLDAELHGVDHDLAFYLVSRPSQCF